MGDGEMRGPVGIINYKYAYTEKGAGVLDIERGQAPGILSTTWQTDTSVGNKSWGYIENETYQTPAFIVQQLADVVSKNGNLLLNIGLRADGTIPKGVQTVLRDVGSRGNGSTAGCGGGSSGGAEARDRLSLRY